MAQCYLATPIPRCLPRSQCLDNLGADVSLSCLGSGLGPKPCPTSCDRRQCHLVLSRKTGLAASLIFIYPRWQIDPSNPIAYLPVLAAISGLFLLWWKRNTRQGYLFFAAAYFVMALLPVLGFFNVYFFRYSFVGDHFQYLASMGQSLWRLPGYIKSTFSCERRRHFYFIWASEILLLGVGTVTWKQSCDLSGFRNFVARHDSHESHLLDGAR